MSAKILVKQVDQAVVTHLAETFDLPHFIAATLASRGVIHDEQVERFLHPSLVRDWRDPYDIEGMEEVIERLLAALKRSARILVFGDFDVDGITAIPLATRA